MTKNMSKGTRKSKKQVNSDKYMKLYEFLMFDPIYKSMSAEAKLLYSYLDKKVYMFEEKQKAYEEGEGTKSYVDEEGDLFIIADNVELTYLFNVSEPTLIKIKKELDSYGLMEEEPVKDGANRIYILNPPELSESWAYIEEIKELRAKKKEEKAKKRLEQKKKRDQQKKEERMKKRQEIVKEIQQTKGDLKNLSHGDTKNLSHGELKNLSKNQSNVFKDQLNSLNINQSISEEIEHSTLPKNIKNILISQIDRLIDFNINISDIELHFHAVKDVFDEAEYNFVLSNLFNKMTVRPKVFADVMNDWLKRNRKREIPEKSITSRKIVRVEKLPDWFEEETNNDEVPVVESISKDQKAKKQEIEDMLKQLRKVE